ncbi:MAG: hypothetical protein AB7V42_10880 [Thermoleophilia bacterium]
MPSLTPGEPPPRAKTTDRGGGIIPSRVDQTEGGAMGVGTGVLTVLLLASGRMREALSASRPSDEVGKALRDEASPGLVGNAIDQEHGLRYECGTCTGLFGERTADAVIRRAAANRHGSAITPDLEVLNGAA